jgi:hypothetical protein
MGKRFAIVIGVAAAGVMALGAQTATSSTGERVDNVPPDLQLSGKKNQKIGPSCESRECRVVLRVITRCGDEACTVSAEGKLTKVKKDEIKPFDHGPNPDLLAPGEKARLELKLSRSTQLKALMKLDKGRNVRARVTVDATDAAGNVATAKRTIKLKLLKHPPAWQCPDGDSYEPPGCRSRKAAAAPDVVKYDTSLDNGHTERCCLYHGSVQSKVRKCERGRRVVLFKKRPGADRGVGHDRSDRHGSWGFVRYRGGGHFYAKVTRERHKGKGFVCLAARAPNVILGQRER